MARSPTVMLRLVASTECVRTIRSAAPASRHLHLVVDDRARQQLLRTMLLVAAARRHAADRIRDKLQVGRAMSIGLVLGLSAIALCQGLFAGGLDIAAHRNLAILSLLTVISLLLVVRHRADERAIIAVRDLEACVAGIEGLVVELRQARIGDADVTHDVRRRYTLVLRVCRARHGHVDYLAARGTVDQAIAHPWRARLHYAADVYLREIAIAAVPLLLFVTL